MKKRERTRSSLTFRAKYPKQLRDWRIENGLSQEDLAARLGIAIKSWQKIERRETVGINIMKKVAAMRGESIDEIFDIPRQTLRQMSGSMPLWPSFAGKSLTDAQLASLRRTAWSLNLSDAKLVDDVIQRMNMDGRLQRALRFRENERAIYKSGKISELLRRYYKDGFSGHHLVPYAIRVGGEQIDSHIVISSEAPAFVIDLKQNTESFQLEASPPNMPPPDYEQLVEYLADAFLLNVRADNDPVFCLRSIDLPAPLKPISFSLAHYFQYRLSYGALGREAVKVLSNPTLSVDKVLANREQVLPKRWNLLRDASALLQFQDGMRVGGVNVFFALRRPHPDNDFAFYVEERSVAVESAQRETCVIPSGFHQPLASIHAAAQISIKESAFRELWEELFNSKKVISHDGHTEPDWYYDYHPLSWFKNNPEKFLHEYICFGLDLIDGSYQCGILLLVMDTRYWRKYHNRICTNFEFRHSGSKLVPISTKRPADIISALTNQALTDTSLLILAEGLQRLQEIEELKKYVDIPKIERVIAKPQNRLPKLQK